MKSTSVYTIGVIAMTAISLVLPTALGAAGYKNADKTGESIAEFRDEIVNVKKAVDATLASLEKIVMEATVDPRGAFKQFDKNVPKVESAATKAKKRAEERTIADAVAYFVSENPISVSGSAPTSGAPAKPGK